jgi:hypothetical protein
VDVVLGATLVPAENTDPRAGMEPIKEVDFCVKFRIDQQRARSIDRSNYGAAVLRKRDSIIKFGRIFRMCLWETCAVINAK